MDAAIFGIIGVIVGGLITSGTQLFFEWRRDKHAVSRAKRLVGGELLNASFIIRTTAAVKSKNWPFFPDPASMFPTAAWQEHRALLAEVLDEDLWNELTMAYAGLEFDRGRFAVAKDLPPNSPLTDPVIKEMKRTVMELERLRRALGGGGGWSEDIPKLMIDPSKTK